jgi:hypothetical protein
MESAVVSDLPTPNERLRLLNGRDDPTISHMSSAPADVSFFNVISCPHRMVLTADREKLPQARLIFDGDGFLFGFPAPLN